MKSTAESNDFLAKYSLNVNGRLLDLTQPRVMGILNVTPDSFYDGGIYKTETEIIGRVEKMLDEGADIIDVGGYSTRPGAAEVEVTEEMTRVLSAIKPVVREFPDAIISVDTFRSTVAKAALDSGASIINDVSGGTLDPSMFTLASEFHVPYILMHMRGTPPTMNSLAAYENLVPEIITELQEKLVRLQEAGVQDVIVDPGFGFAKTVAQNFELLRSLHALRILDRPLLVGFSRKSMIWKTLNISPEEALNGTTALHAAALLKGAVILRVHDVREAVQTVQLIRHLKITAD